jgi:hypothetical protein
MIRRKGQSKGSVNLVLVHLRSVSVVRQGFRLETLMTKPLQRDAIYLKRHFDAEIIVLCVRWYITYNLSYRDLAAMMAERAVVVRTPPSCAGLFATRPSSRSVGVGSRDPSAARGVSTRLTSRLCASSIPVISFGRGRPRVGASLRTIWDQALTP